MATAPTEPYELEAAGVCVNEFGNAIGMPQLCDAWFANQIFWLLVALGAIYFLLTRIALPRLGAVLAERQGTITNDLAAAEDLKHKAEDAEAAYERALADARAEANRIGQEARDAIRADLDAAIADADARIAERTAASEREISQIRAGAAESVEAVARDVAAEIVRVLGGDPDPDSVNAAVDGRVKGA